MKTWKYLLSFALAVALVATVYAGDVTVTGAGRSVSNITNTIAASQVDTVRWVREPGVTALSFGLHVNDTCDIDANKVWVLRVVNGLAQAVIAGDTLTAITIDVDAAASKVNAITLAPLADQYWVIVNYTATGVGVSGNETATYEFIKQYSR